MLDQNQGKASEAPKLPIREVLTPKVTTAVLSYGCLALLDIAYAALHPLFYATKVELGGLGLSVPHIGLVSGLTSIWVGLVITLCFSEAHSRFGTRRMFVMGLFTFLPLFALFPIMNMFARFYGHGLLTISALVLQQGLSPSLGMSYCE